MKAIGKILMLLAVSILMLHTITPHQHHEEVDEMSHVREHESAKSLLDFISLAFHFSPSENHLEDFEKSNQAYSFDFLQSPILNWQLESPVVIRSSKVLKNQEAGDTQPFRYTHHRFRGPPQNS